MTATSEPGRYDDWVDTGPIPLPVTRPATQTPEQAAPAPAPVGESDEARAARFAEAIGLALATSWVLDESAHEALTRSATSAAMAVADAEQAQLRKDVAGQTRSAMNGWRNADLNRARAAAAEAEVRDLRAKVAELTQDRDEWKQATIAANRRFEAAEVQVAAVEALAERWAALGAGDVAWHWDMLAEAVCQAASVGRTEPADWMSVRGDGITFPDPHDYGRTTEPRV